MHLLGENLPCQDGRNKALSWHFPSFLVLHLLEQVSMAV